MAQGRRGGGVHQRRGRLAGLGVVFLTMGLAGQVLPDAWWVDVPVLGLACRMVYEVFERLRPSHPALTDTSGHA